MDNCFCLNLMTFVFFLTQGTFPGLLPLLHSYLASMDVDVNTHCTITQYLHLISKRASGELMTTASWIREKVTTHPDYKCVLLLSFCN